MNYGLIGEKLSHSFSAQIHQRLSGCDYALKELAPAQLEDFLRHRAFRGINVTIPYKQAVIPLLDEIDPVAARIGAVNTIVNRDGKLHGYNTDYAGLKALIDKNDVNLAGKTVLILGTGGTSLTAGALARDMGAAQVVRVSRSEKEGAVSYETAASDFGDAHIIINTTPVGMYPHLDAAPIDLSAFSALEAVFDCVYNPLRTRLVLQAGERGIKAEGGLYMLVAQAIYASELFLNTTYDAAVFDAVYRDIEADRESIVLIGMPGSGKSTVGKCLSEQLGKPLYDTDDFVRAEAGTDISDIFAARGEGAFRMLESRVIGKLAARSEGAIIATGGGAVLDRANVTALKQNGRLYFLDRRLEDIVPTADRPLALDRQALKQRYEERYDTYLRSADRHICVQTDAAGVADIIRKDFLRES